MTNERQELLSNEYFMAVAKEAERLARVAEKDGFTVRDFAVIGMLMQDAAAHAVGATTNDS